MAEAARLIDSREANYAFGSVVVHRKDRGGAPTSALHRAEAEDYRGPDAVGVALFLAKDDEAALAELLPFAERKETAAGRATSSRGSPAR